MDWGSVGFGGAIIGWLEDAAQARYVRDLRLDPFATSMRDFDDVAPNLKSLRDGNPPTVSDPVQRLGDLRAAGLAGGRNVSLSPLGAAVLKSWEQFGVDTNRKDDEFARLLIFVFEGRRTGSAEVRALIDYWQDIRANFDPYAAIENWDALYALNYMDFTRDGFAPGRVIRDLKIPIEEVEFDLTNFARSIGADQSAVDGGVRVESALKGKIPRGRHRATFCMALEIDAGGQAAATTILSRFGTPRRPRSWTSFSNDQREKIAAIVKAYAPVPAEAAQRGPVAAEASPVVESQPTVGRARDPLTLPEDIDFSGVLVPRPAGNVAKDGQNRGGAPRKRDYLLQAQDDSEVGKLGETFALRFERWRLRDRPDLVERVRYVAETDDTLGYDIESFEPDGTPRFVEVKTTTSAIESRFFISSNEIEVANRIGTNYVILRVGQITTEPRCCEYRFPFEGKLNLATSTYLATPAA